MNKYINYPTVTGTSIIDVTIDDQGLIEPGLYSNLNTVMQEMYSQGTAKESPASFICGFEFGNLKKNDTITQASALDILKAALIEKIK